MANFIPKIEFGTGPTTITFDLPPEGDFRSQNFNASEKTSTSNNGTEQTQFNFTEDRLGLSFFFISETIKTQMDNFMLTHALRGLEFSYFESNDEVAFITVTLRRKRWSPTIMFAEATPGNFIYEFDLDMRELKT